LKQGCCELRNDVDGVVAKKRRCPSVEEIPELDFVERTLMRMCEESADL
jgi:hypothetical protein